MKQIGPPFKKLLKILFVSGLLASSPCLADSIWETPNVWDQAKQISNSFEGKIKTIDTFNQDLYVTVVTKKTRRAPQRTERFKVCTSHAGGDIHNLVEAQLVSSLREAQSLARPVRVTYESVYNRCITTVTRI